MKNKRVLISCCYLSHYRIQLYHKLGESYNVTVIHSGKKVNDGSYRFNELLVPEFKIWKFHLQPQLIVEILKNRYDIIISLIELSWITNIVAILFKYRTSKFIFWGAWFTQNIITNNARIILTKKADANIFYTERTRIDFVRKGVNEEITFVANNTLDVGKRIKSFFYDPKFRILFVGSLDKRKQLNILIRAFNNIKNKISHKIILTIIGSGKEKNYLKNLTKSFNLEKSISFEGKITNPEFLRNFYKESIISVSFGQAGLSVLQSFGFGVPFLTKKNAISGGEIENIIDGFNSLLCEDKISSLENKLIYVCNNIEYAKKLGENAYHYYSKYCTIENMAQGFLDAIENTRLSNIDNKY